MGQSNEQNNEFFNLLVTTLVQSQSEDSVRGAMSDFKENIPFQHGLILDYLSDVIVIISLIFTIALIVYERKWLSTQRHVRDLLIKTRERG